MQVAKIFKRMTQVSAHNMNKVPYLMIPYAPRGRDFDEHFRHFTFPLFELCESIPYYSSIDSKLDTQFCDCMIYSKCQFLKVYYPITLKLFQQSIADANIKAKKDDQCNTYPSPFYMRCCLGNIGRTSYTQFVDLMYKNTVFASFAAICVHVDPITRKPVQNCKKLMDHKQKYSDAAGDTEPFYQEMRASMNTLTSLMSQNKYILYSHTFELRPIDRDWNKHMNQSVYMKRIEDSLYDYHKDFAKGVYAITQVDHLFLNETNVAMDSSSECEVMILIHTRNKDKTEQIVGCMKQNDKECLHYRVILTPVTDVSCYQSKM
eukprot:529116_1